MTIKETIDKIILVNDKWLKEKPQMMSLDWTVACYFMGCMEAYKATGKKEYLDAVIEWAEHNHWETDHYGDVEFAKNKLIPFFTYKDRCSWQYENPADYLKVHADYIACGRTYMELQKFVPEIVHMDKVLDAMYFTLSDEHNDYWFWVDAIHMALCLYHLVAQEMSDDRFAKKAHLLYENIKEDRGCYDKEEHLWYRDKRYFPENAYSKNGKKIFWSRGNGWVYAGLIQTLSILDKDSPYYAGYKETFLEMTDAIVKCQSEDGFWRASLLDPEEFPEIETSGTLLFLHSMLRSIRLGILPESYIEVFRKGFEAVNREAISEEGVLEWVQGVASGPGATYKETTKDYAVGYYLMTCCEWIEYCRETGENS